METYECKFTPLGFETSKLSPEQAQKFECKFTPLGFETKESVAAL